MNTSNDGKFLFERALIDFNNKNYASAKNNLLKCLDLNFKDADCYHLLAICYSFFDDHISAIDYYEHAIQLSRNDAQLFSNYASSLYSLKRNQDALIFQIKALEIDPDNYEYLYNLGNIYCGLELYNKALEFYKKAIDINPLFAPLLNNYGKALFDLGSYSESLVFFNRALNLDPYYLDCLNNKAIAHKELKQFDEALACLRVALNLNQNHSETLLNFGVLFCSLKKFPAALDFFDKAIATKPNYPEAWLNKGSVFYGLKKYSDSLFCNNKALIISPFYAEALSNKAAALIELGRLSEALISYENALTLKPDLKWQFGSLIHTKLKLGIWNNFAEDIHKIIDGIQEFRKICQPFLCLLLIDNPAIHKLCAEIYSNDEFLFNSSLGNLKKYKNEKIRIGYFSGDFGTHAVSSLIVECFELHDKNHFEIIAFSANPIDGSLIQQRVIKAFNEFIEIDKLSDYEVAELARNKKIDIAIDLGCYTGTNRPGPFSYRAAPIQVNYLGYPGTSGSVFMDYIIADKTLIPQKEQINFSEKVVYMPDCYQPNDRNKLISNKIFSKFDFGLPSHGFVFCCFNNNFKILPGHFRIWINILNSVDNSLLWLLKDDDLFEKNIRSMALEFGVNPDRIFFAERMPHSEHLARHQLADLFLDTFPYNAHTTASDALWAGLPVLTLQGNSFASRVASSLLTAVNIPELICYSEKEYEKKAIQIAQDVSAIRDLKNKLKKNLLSTPLYNTPLMTHNLERAFNQMYNNYVNNLDIDHIYL